MCVCACVCACLYIYINVLTCLSGLRWPRGVDGWKLPDEQLHRRMGSHRNHRRINVDRRRRYPRNVDSPLAQPLAQAANRILPVSDHYMYGWVCVGVLV